MSPLSTAEVARKVGVHPITLERWIADGKVRPSKVVRIGRRNMRLWTDADIERVRRHKAEFYRKGRGRRRKKA